MRKHIRLVIAGALVAAFGVAVLVANPGTDAPADAADVEPQQDPPAADLLRKALEPYADRTQFAGTFVLTQTIEAAGDVQEGSLQLDYALSLPDKLYLRMEGEGIDMAVACDGETYRAYMPSTDKYLEMPAPDDARGLLESELLGPLSDPRLHAMTFGLFLAGADTRLLANATDVALADDERLGDRQAERLVIQTEEDELTLWLAADTGQLLRLELDLQQAVKELREQGADVKAFRLAVDLDPPAADAPLPEDAFALNLPEDARRAEDMADLMQVDLTGREAVDFELAGLEEGATWRLSDLKGQVVALDFWASWCGPCRIEMPLLAAIYQDLKDEGLVLLGVNVKEGREKITGFIEETKLDIPVAMDTDGRVSGSYLVSGLPTLVLIGRDGVIQAVHRGYAPGIEKVIRREVEALLAGKSLLAE